MKATSRERREAHVTCMWNHLLYGIRKECHTSKAHGATSFNPHCGCLSFIKIIEVCKRRVEGKITHDGSLLGIVYKDSVFEFDSAGPLKKFGPYLAPTSPARSFLMIRAELLKSQVQSLKKQILLTQPLSNLALFGSYPIIPRHFLWYLILFINYT
jgi:hypothetical protein